MVANQVTFLGSSKKEEKVETSQRRDVVEDDPFADFGDSVTIDDDFLEKIYLFNPFQIKNITNAKLQEMYQSTYEKLNAEPNTMYEFAHNIEVYSNLMYICGECIARFTRDIIALKSKIEINSAIKTTEERKLWKKEDGKMPSIDYFKALATRFCEEDIKELADKECFLKRFKNAYNSIEEKMNSLKKKMEAVKFEEFNQ